MFRGRASSGLLADADIATLLQDCSIELTVGRRYGLIGQNGSGKTNFLQVLANREVRKPHATNTAR
jgi:ATPase subunit of ABC transporter with duplicated ATPase domains